MQAAQMVDRFLSESSKLAELTMVAHVHQEFQGEFLRAEIAYKHDQDIIFHLFMKKFPKQFEVLLAEIVEAQFGTTEMFSVHYEPLLNSWSILASGLLSRPGLRIDQIVSEFLNLIDNTIGELRQELK